MQLGTISDLGPSGSFGEREAMAWAAAVVPSVGWSTATGVDDERWQVVSGLDGAAIAFDLISESCKASFGFDDDENSIEIVVGLENPVGVALLRLAALETESDDGD